MLEDHADAPTQRHQVVFVEATDVHLINQHPAAAGLLQTVDGTDQRRLASTAAADDAEHFTTLDRQVDALQCWYGLTVVGLAQVDKPHMGAIQVGVQLGLFGVLGRRIEVAQLGIGGTHVQPSQPAWYSLP